MLVDEANRMLVLTFVERLDENAAVNKLVEDLGEDGIAAHLPEQQMEAAAKRRKTALPAFKRLGFAAYEFTKPVEVSRRRDAACQADGLRLEQSPGCEHGARLRRRGAAHEPAEIESDLDHFGYGGGLGNRRKRCA